MLHSNVKQSALFKGSNIIRALMFAILFGILGLSAGWFTFAQVRGRRLPFRLLPLVMRAPPIVITEGGFAGLREIRQKILLCTGAGAIVGILLSALKSKRRGAPA
jgi:hypothetical protein